MNKTTLKAIYKEQKELSEILNGRPYMTLEYFRINVLAERIGKTKLALDKIPKKDKK